MSAVQTEYRENIPGRIADRYPIILVGPEAAARERLYLTERETADGICVALPEQIVPTARPAESRV
jgi:hypothetical protein